MKSDRRPSPEDGGVGLAREDGKVRRPQRVPSARSLPED